MQSILLWENLKGGDHLKGLGLDVKIILEWIIKNTTRKCGLDASGKG